MENKSLKSVIFAAFFLVLGSGSAQLQAMKTNEWLKKQKNYAQQTVKNARTRINNGINKIPYLNQGGYYNVLKAGIATAALIGFKKNTKQLLGRILRPARYGSLFLTRKLTNLSVRTGIAGFFGYNAYKSHTTEYPTNHQRGYVARIGNSAGFLKAAHRYIANGEQDVSPARFMFYVFWKRATVEEKNKASSMPWAVDPKGLWYHKEIEEKETGPIKKKS